MRRLREEARRVPDVSHEDGRVPRRRGVHAGRQSGGPGHRGGGARRGRARARSGAGGGAASTNKASQRPRALGRRVVERAAGQEAGVAAQEAIVSVLIYVASILLVLF